MSGELSSMVITTGFDESSFVARLIFGWLAWCLAVSCLFAGRLLSHYLVDGFLIRGLVIGILVDLWWLNCCSLVCGLD